MPLYCSISSAPDHTGPEIVVVRGVGKVTRSDIEQYLKETIEGGVKGHAKLILLGISTLSLSPADLDAVATSLVDYGRGERPGPVAIVAGNALNLDMALLLKQRVGNRPFSIFVDAREAARWIGDFYASKPAGVAGRDDRPSGPWRSPAELPSWPSLPRR
ncbi:hypothetical protein BH10PSE6_BH10PSE6_14480 [soil metagenome]